MLQITADLRLEYRESKKELDSKIPLKVRENYEQGSLVSRINTKPIEWRGSQVGDDPVNPIVPYNVWAREQQRLAEKLRLKSVQAYLVHFCSICGEPTKKGTKVDLCESHYKKQRREYKAKHEKARRDRLKSQRGQ